MARGMAILAVCVNNLYSRLRGLEESGGAAVFFQYSP